MDHQVGSSVGRLSHHHGLHGCSLVSDQETGFGFALGTFCGTIDVGPPMNPSIHSALCVDVCLLTKLAQTEAGFVVRFIVLSWHVVQVDRTTWARTFETRAKLPSITQVRVQNSARIKANF